MEIKKKILIIFLSIYLIIGSLNSIKTGISFDENYEELNWNFHKQLVIDLKNKFIHGEEFNKKKFDEEVKGFVGYGIGFQIVSQPIQNFLQDILAQDNKTSLYGAKLLSKHFVVFLFFFISGIFFYLILRKVVENEDFRILALIIYLTYPYLFGQSMFSPKDVPFLSIWVVCTFLSFNLLEKIIDKKTINIKSVLIFSLVTSYLVSIRIAGILIFLQYFFLLVLYLSIYKQNIIQFLKNFYFKITTFIIGTVILTFLLNPIFFIDPSLIITTIKINANHFNNVGTTTFGKIMYSKDLPSTYIPIWMAVKIPIIIILGILLLPFTEKRIFENKKNATFFGTLLLTIISIPLILIFNKVHLYDEIRQIMFLIPIIFIIGLVSLFTFSRSLFYTLGIISIIFFVIENIKINPYQYVWFNLPSRYIDLTNKFELEYQGISGKKIAEQISKKRDQNICILANPIHVIKPFLHNTNFNCFDVWQKIDTNFERPFLAVQNVRNLKKSLPYKCKVIDETGFKLIFHKKKFVTGKLLKCE